MVFADISKKIRRTIGFISHTNIPHIFASTHYRNRMITTWKDDVSKRRNKLNLREETSTSEGSDSAEGQRNAAIAFVLPLLVSALISSATPYTTAYREFFCPEHTTVRKLRNAEITVIHWKSQPIRLYIIIVNLCQVLMIRSCRPHRKTAFGRSIGT